MLPERAVVVIDDLSREGERPWDEIGGRLVRFAPRECANCLADPRSCDHSGIQMLRGMSSLIAAGRSLRPEGVERELRVEPATVSTSTRRSRTNFFTIDFLNFITFVHYITQATR